MPVLAGDHLTVKATVMTQAGYGSSSSHSDWESYQAAGYAPGAAPTSEATQAAQALAAHQERERRWHSREQDTSVMPDAGAGGYSPDPQYREAPARVGQVGSLAPEAAWASTSTVAAAPAQGHPQPAPATAPPYGHNSHQSPAAFPSTEHPSYAGFESGGHDSSADLTQPLAALPAQHVSDQPAGYGQLSASASAYEQGGYQQTPPTSVHGSAAPAADYQWQESLASASPVTTADPQPYGQGTAFATHEALDDGGAGLLSRPPVAFEVPRQASAPLAAQSYLLAASEEQEQEATARVGTVAAPTLQQQDQVNLADLLQQVLDQGASDLHLTANIAPTLRLHGELHPLTNYPPMTSESVQSLLYAVLTQKQRETFENDLELDFAYTLPGKGRFRVNIYRQRNSLGAAFRLIPFEIKPLEALGVPPTVAQFASLPRGFVLVTGPTGSGKSTTLASLVDLANRTRKDHILTVEDPIEFLHEHQSCVVNQREVGEDTHSFADALKHALRQDPDIILVGELRDLETISVALTAAETGHLVFATLHTQDAPQTIDRLIDVFPAHQQEQIRVQLAGALQGVVTQTLCKTADGQGRAVATEVLVATPAVRNLIREGKVHQIHSSMQAGAKYGMHTLDQHLADLVKRGRVTFEVAVEKCRDEQDLRRLLGQE